MLAETSVRSGQLLRDLRPDARRARRSRPRPLRAFLRGVFGAVVVYREGGFVQVQTPGSRDVIVFQRDEAGAGTKGGVLHFGFRLVDATDIDAAADAVERAGGRILDRGEFAPGEPYLFFEDPDGYEVEIWYESTTPVDA